MAFRAAAASPQPVDGVIAVGGDVPPELDAGALARVRAALVCRGERDEWYTAAKFENDVRRLRDAGAAVRPMPFAGGHEWSQDVLRAAADFLDELR
jgi:predicted esterase